MNCTLGLRLLPLLLFLSTASTLLFGQRNLHLFYNQSGATVTDESSFGNLVGINSLPGIGLGMTLPVWRHDNESFYVALSPTVQFRRIEGVNEYSDINQISTTVITENTLRGLVPIHAGYRFEISETLSVTGFGGLSIGVDLVARKNVSSCVQFLQEFGCFESNFDYEYGRDDIWFSEEFALGPYPWTHNDVSKYRRIDLGVDIGIELAYLDWGLRIQNRTGIMPYATRSLAAINFFGEADTKWYHRDLMVGVARYF